MAKLHVLFAVAAVFLFYYLGEWAPSKATIGVAAYIPHGSFYPGCECNCPTYSGCGGGQPPSSYPLKDCTAQCDVAKQGDCLCTKNFHPTGCTLQPCKPEDDTFEANYTCYCTPTAMPFDCVAPSNSSNPMCTPAEDALFVDANCTCNTEAADPDNCTIRLCEPNEETGPGYRCICGESCDRYSRGCVKEPSK